MITLYQLHWSHFVEKVRWALDYKGLPWTAVDVDPFTKRQMHHLPCKLKLDSGRTLHTVPTIHDRSNDCVVSDSSQILEYLEQTYPKPALYPEEPQEREQVRKWMLWLDSTLGLAARRLGYTQIALEHPGILTRLFMPQTAGDRGSDSIKGKIGGIIIAGVLSQRFRFRHNRRDRVFEDLEQCLQTAAAVLSSQSFLVGDRFTAADLTLATLSRPARLVPYFLHHPQLQGLWEWRARLVREHQRQQDISYEVEINDIRKRRGWALGAVGWMSADRIRDARASTAIPSLLVARNDQEPVGRWPLISGPVAYLRLALTSNLGRTPYP
jgi:glutathione S-transferase